MAFSILLFRYGDLLVLLIKSI